LAARDIFLCHSGNVSLVAAALSGSIAPVLDRTWLAESVPASPAISVFERGGNQDSPGLTGSHLVNHNCRYSHQIIPVREPNSVRSYTQEPVVPFGGGEATGWMIA